MDWYEVADPETPTETHRCERCLSCHVNGKHDWTEWTTFPECEWCEGEMMTFIDENVDKPWDDATMYLCCMGLGTGVYEGDL